MQTLKTILVLIIAVCTASFLYADIQTTAIKMGLDVLTKPNDFFIEINADTENIGPDPFDKRLQINFSLLWNILSVGNMQAKYRAYEGTSLWPEITPGFSFWYIWGLHLLPADDFSASAYGYTPFITFSRKYDKNVKLFTGVKYAMGSINFEMKETDEEEDEPNPDNFGLDFSSIMEGISSSYGEFSFYTGINYQRKSGREVVALVGYYPMIKKLFSKLQVSSGVFDYGMSLYPDSFLLMHFYMNIHINLL